VTPLHNDCRVYISYCGVSCAGDSHEICDQLSLPSRRPPDRYRLLTHTHALANIKAQLLTEISHVPIALLGMTAGLARWLELRLDGPPSRIASRIWPVAFALVGLILLFYREA